MCVWIYRGKVQPEPRNAAEQRVQSLKQTETPAAPAPTLKQDTAARNAVATEQVSIHEPQG
jgi:hypothetical protein